LPPSTRRVAHTAGSCAQGSLRTKQTIEKFKSVPVQPGTTSPLLVYFGTLLTRGKLNAFESVELSRLVLSQNKKHLLDNWFKARARLCPACFGPLTQQSCICIADDLLVCNTDVFNLHAACGRA